MLCFGLWAVPTAAHNVYVNPTAWNTVRKCRTVRECVRVPGTSERQPLTYDGVIEPGASG